MTGRRLRSSVFLLPLLLAAIALGAPAGTPAEPNAEVAAGWWPDIENTWVPIGWKDHPLRFNVLFNGTLVAQPVRYPARGQGVQLTFLPSRHGELPAATSTQPYQLSPDGGGLENQGWTQDAAPVLWARWRRDGLTLRQEVFGHIAGGGEVKTGTEPLFAWVRLSVEDVAPGASFDRCGWLIRINAPHIRTKMDRYKNLIAHPKNSAYPRPLQLEATVNPQRGRHLLLDDAGRVRLAVLSDPAHKVRFIERPPSGLDAYFHIEIPAATGAHADLLVPLVPAESAAAHAEVELGREAALNEANRSWSVIPETAARVDTPEPLVNEAIRQAPRFAETIAERHPETGQYALLSGSWHYEKLWATPTSMVITMILDGLGHHGAADKYLEIFRQEQGTITPPGKAYRKHPGYLATPRRFTSIDWLTDHGAILYAAARHALVTDDQQFIARWTNPILKACEFIRDSRAATGHGGVEGILLLGVPTDSGIAEQSVWSDGWNYKGLVTAVRLLRRIHHPRAEEFAREAADYRETFQRAIRAAMPHMPEWTDADGRSHRFVPTALPKGGDLKFPFYLDTGPLFLVYGELMPADDELMRSAREYFRAGPNRRTYDLKGAWHQPVSLQHELSSCEPCYSWNVFHSWQAADREKFLEGMYSLFGGALSRHTSIGCEHRGGVSGTLFSVPLPVELARLSVIDDQIEPGRLHLLRLVPLAWLRGDRPTVFERVPTEFGPVTLHFQLQENGHRLFLAFEPRFRNPPQGIAVHVPPLDGLTEVAIDGRVHKVQPGEVIALK